MTTLGLYQKGVNNDLKNCMRFWIIFSIAQRRWFWLNYFICDLLFLCWHGCYCIASEVNSTIFSLAMSLHKSNQLSRKFSVLFILSPQKCSIARLLRYFVAMAVLNKSQKTKLWAVQTALLLNALPFLKWIAFFLPV